MKKNNSKKDKTCIPSNKSSKQKKEQVLDKTLKDTFPASDATAKY